MFYNGDKTYSPLICVGRDIQFSNQLTIDCLCVSPSGRIAIVEQDPASRNEAQQDFLARVKGYAEHLKTLSCSLLDDICEAYYYHKEGQAARVIDKMAYHGLLTFSEAVDFSTKVNIGLQYAPLLVMISVEDDHLEIRKRELQDCILEDSDLLFAFVTKSMCDQFS